MRLQLSLALILTQLLGAKMNKKLNNNRVEISDKIKRSQINAILRFSQQSDVSNVLKCLVTGGIKTLEITSNTPGYLEEISLARAKYPQILIGAGTIINAELAIEAIAAGAQFLVTPNTDKEIIEIAHANDIPVLMGALTPTDIANCIKFDADFIKLFPAGSLGIKYLKDLSGPFSSTSLIPVGGVNINNIEDWFAAGAIGVGVGNDLSKSVNTAQEQKSLIELAQLYVCKLPKVQ